MSDTTVADVLDGLYDLLAAEATLAAAITAGTLTLSDGPPLTQWSAASMLVVGGRPRIEDDTAAVIGWEWSAMGVSGGHADVAENIDVPCGLTTLDGTANMRDCRRTALTLYAAAAAAIRDSTLGLGHVMWCIPSVAPVHQLQTQQGAECSIDFTVHVRAQI